MALVKVKFKPVFATKRAKCSNPGCKVRIDVNQEVVTDGHGNIWHRCCYDEVGPDYAVATKIVDKQACDTCHKEIQPCAPAVHIPYYDSDRHRLCHQSLPLPPIKGTRPRGGAGYHSSTRLGGFGAKLAHK